MAQKVLLDRPDQVFHLPHPDNREWSLCGAVGPGAGPPRIEEREGDLDPKVPICVLCEAIDSGEVETLKPGELLKTCPFCGIRPTTAARSYPIAMHHVREHQEYPGRD